MKFTKRSIGGKKAAAKIKLISAVSGVKKPKKKSL